MSNDRFISPKETPKKKTIKHIIFDFDGTLVDTAPVILATMFATFQELGLPAPSQAACKSTIGLRLYDIPAQLFPDRENLGELYTQTYQRLFKEYNRPGAAVPFEGVVDTLKRLKAKGFQLAIASSRHRSSLEDFIVRLHLIGIFDKVIGGDDVVHGKPAPDPVIAITDSMGWRPEETLVVGDAGVDIRMGNAAACHTCGVTYGNGTVSELQEAGAAYLINSFAELEEVIEAPAGTANG